MRPSDELQELRRQNIETSRDCARDAYTVCKHGQTTIDRGWKRGTRTLTFNKNLEPALVHRRMDHTPLQLHCVTCFVSDTILCQLMPPQRESESLQTWEFFEVAGIVTLLEAAQNAKPQASCTCVGSNCGDFEKTK